MNFPLQRLRHQQIITINYPLIYMVRDVMSLMRQIHYKGWALKIKPFLEAKMATSKAFWMLKWQWAHHSSIKIIKFT
jgi:hypothetical protein